MDLTAQVIALLFLNFLIFYYVKTPRLPLLSQKCFTVMFILAIVNLAFDFLTNFTIANPDNISERVNRFCHDGFLGSLSTLVFVFALYTILVARNQVRLGRRAICIFSIPYVISILFILFGRIEYYRSENANYSYGQAVQVFFAEAVLYLIFCKYPCGGKAQGLQQGDALCYSHRNIYLGRIIACSILFP